ncbi:MAG TPA: DUF6763 family protein [Steroidobacteraceae bacterium]|nr:DUF6763 family protein [Steroidobacteraceae bacterium]
MNSIQWPPRVGAWYLRWDKGEIFQVTGYDASSRKASIRTYNGEPGELDQFTWDRLSLGVADPPEDWTGPLETVDVVRFGSTPDDPISEDVAEPIARDQ